MLGPAEVIPFLTDDRPFVQDLAIDYLKDAADLSLVTADDLWHAIDQSGSKRRRRLLRTVAEMPQTETSYRRTIDALGDRAFPTDDRELLLSVIRSFDVPLVQRHRDELLANHQLDEKTTSHLRRLLELADQPPDALWEQLLQYVRQFDEDDREEKRPNEQEMDRFILAIGQSPDDAPARAVDVLKNSADDWTWARVPALMLLMKIPHEPAIATLIDQLDLDEDWIWEFGPKVLSRNGNAAVAQIETAFSQSPEGSKISMSSALGRIKTPQSEAALHRLLLAEPDSEPAHMLAGALCLLVPPPAILSDIRDVQIAGRLDMGMPMYDIPEMIMAAGAMVGYEPPEAKQWLEKIDRDRKRIARMMRSDKLPNIFQPAAAAIARPEPQVAYDDVVQPIHRAAPKVGRNDPCPCGSGKKYKKCCGA